MESFNTYTEQMLGYFPHLMIYAVLEWIMIILLFIDGLLAFISNEFANFFGLRIPCLLCTRIDHILVHRNSNFYYNDSICEAHKKDISTLVYCHTHRKLSDIRTMCQGCLVSFSSNCDKYKSIVRTLHKDIDLLVEKREDDEKSGDIPWCSCCGEIVKLKSSMKYTRNMSMKSQATTPCGSWLLSRDADVRSIETPRTRYVELKFVADGESEFPQSDTLNAYNQAGREDIKAATTQFLQDPEDINEDTNKTPSLLKGSNKYFGIQFDSAQGSSPRWLNRTSTKPPSEKDTDSLLDLTPPNEPDSDIFNHVKKIDHKSLMEIYMELDEERNAAAVAANNAMAMITRIQAEKAAVQMEALQYQRMMEEQAEYDEAAMQVMREMILKKDEDVKDLESELEIYRERYGPIAKVGSDICEVDDDEDFSDIRSEKSDNESSDGGDRVAIERPCERSFDFEGERSYLVGLLADLEKKIIKDGKELGMVENEGGDGGKGKNENKVMLTREVSVIKERLRVIEADSGFLKHAAMMLQIGGEGTKLLTEIAQHLRMLRRTAGSPTDDIDF